MSDSNGGQIGLTILGTISAFSVWSALSPSFFTIKKFADEEDESSTRALRFGMKMGMILDILLGVGLYLGYGKKGLWPGIATAATGVGLWTTYDQILKGNLQV
jgi:hypothetical protein